MRILAISGSLRAGSTNGALLEAAALVAPPGVAFARYLGLCDLPHFNPDLERSGGPAVDDLRASLSAADGVLICSPEYAHGIPGALKNALDWVVGSGELVAKPVGLLNASARATHAQAALAEVLTTMSARLVPGASIAVAVPGGGRSPSDLVADPAIGPALRSAVWALVEAIDGP